MAVHRRGYRQYDGPRTPERWRFWILARYAFERVFQSRLLVIFYVICFVPTVIALSAVYLSHHVDVLMSLFPRASMPDTELVPVNEEFFLLLMSIQASLSVFVTALIGPSLVSPDLTNNALPLFFSRPFSRAEYVLGKFSVLFILLSLITGAPMLLIYRGIGVVYRKHPLRIGDRARFFGLGHAHFARCSGLLGMGTMAAGGGWNAVRSVFHPGGLRAGGQRNHAHRMGQSLERHHRDRHVVELALLYR